MGKVTLSLHLSIRGVAISSILPSIIFDYLSG
jgi:hypothetical protein